MASVIKPEACVSSGYKEIDQIGIAAAVLTEPVDDGNSGVGNIPRCPALAVEFGLTMSPESAFLVFHQCKLRESSVRVASAFIHHDQVVVNGDVVGDGVPSSQTVPASRHAHIQRLTHALTYRRFIGPAEEIQVDAAE